MSAPERDELLLEVPPFRVEHGHSDAMHDRTRWVIPLEGQEAGECLLLEPGGRLESGSKRMLIAASR